MAQGKKNDDLRFNSKPDSAFAILPPVALGVLTLTLGLYIPPAINGLLHDVAVAIGGF